MLSQRIEHSTRVRVIPVQPGVHDVGLRGECAPAVRKQVATMSRVRPAADQDVIALCGKVVFHGPAGNIRVFHENAGRPEVRRPDELAAFARHAPMRPLVDEVQLEA